MSMELAGAGSSSVQSALAGLKSSGTSSDVQVSVLKKAMDQSTQGLDLLNKTLQQMDVGNRVNVSA